MPQTFESVLLERANPHAGKLLKKIARLAKKHNLQDYYFTSGPNVSEEGEVYFEMSVFPVLPFFLGLAKVCDVPIEQVHVDAESVSTGYCETCAGHGLEVTVRVEGVFRDSPATPGEQHG